MEGWLVRLLKLVIPKFLNDSLDTSLRNLKIQAERDYKPEKRGAQISPFLRSVVTLDKLDMAVV